MKKKQVICTLLATQLLFSSLPVAAQQELETQSTQTVEQESAQTVEEESTQIAEESMQESLESAKATETITVGDCTLKGDASSGYTVTKYNGSATNVDLTTGDYEAYTITAIGDSAFYNKDSLLQVVLPDTVEMIGRQAFSGCDALQKCNLPKNLLSIGNQAFQYTAITEVTIPASCISIGEYAFRSCSNLKTVSFEEREGDLTFGQEALRGCEALKELIIPEGITAIPDSFCLDNTSLTKVQLPSTCTSIGKSAFSGCTKLEQVNIPDFCDSLGSKAFYNTAIKSVQIPATITSLPASVFESCDNLEEVTFAERTEEISIGESAFRSCSALTSITLPDGVKTIEDYTFHSCSKLSKVELPESCTAIGERVFQWCTSLKELTIPAACETIGACAFYGCNTLTKLTFENGETVIGQSAFYGVDTDKLVIESELGGTVEEYAKELEVNIQCKSEEISITKLPDKTTYFYGEALVLDGITISAKLITQEGTEIKDIEIEECTVSGFDSKKVGKQEITITYGGVSASFNVYCYYDMSKMTVSCYDTEYSGVDKIDSILTVTNGSNKLVNGVDYVIEYEGDLINVGDKTVRVVGIGNYKGEKKVEFTIRPKNLNFITGLNVQVGNTEYTGKECIPAVTITYGTTTLTANDYSVQCTNNINAGTADITITGKNNYQGIIEKTFTINKKSLQGAVITLEKDIYAYDGTAKNPVVTVTLNGKTLMKNVDYYVSYSNNMNVGNASVTVYGMGNYSGASSKDYKINVIPGTSHVVGAYKYKVLNDKEVTLVSMTNKADATVTVPASIRISGKIFKVTAIADKAFSGAKATKITIGTNVTKIGKQAFKNTRKLTKLTIKSKKIKSVGKGALKGINAKAQIKVPKTKLSAYKKLFKNKGQSKKVKIVK